MTLDPVLPIAVLLVATLLLAGLALWQARAARGSARVEWLIRTTMVVLLLVIALRPTIPGNGTGPVATGGLEVYFALDTTSSMAAEDSASAEAPSTPSDGATPTRLDAAKADIEALTSQLAGAQFSLTTFDGSTVQRVPLTSDASALLAATDAVTQEVTFYSNGSSIDEPLVFLTDLLSAAQQEHPDRRRVLFYLGDGEQTRDQEPVTFRSLAPYIGGGGVIGYGTDAGGPMLQYSGFDPGLDADADEGTPVDTQYIQDPSGSGPAVSRIDRENLQAIAGQLQVPYRERAEVDSVADLTEGIDVGDVQISAGSIGGPVEFYWVLAIPLGLLALREILGTALALAAARPGSRAG